MIITVTANPSVDHVLFVNGFKLHDTNRATNVERDAGGKGLNASRVISNLGGHTLATGFVGGGTGAFILHAMVEEGLRHHFVPIREENRLNVAVEDNSGQPPTSINEPGPLVTEAETEELVRVLSDRLRPNDWLLVAGSLPRGIGPDFYLRLGKIAREKLASFAIDADGECLKLGLQAGPSFLKPNVTEAERLLGRKLESEEAIQKAAGELLALVGKPGGIVVISRGKDGAIMADGDGLWIGEPAEIEVRSTVGSGDSMVGAMLHGLSGGMSSAEALALGMAAGAATASIQGSGVARREDVLRLLPSCRVRQIAPCRPGR